MFYILMGAILIVAFEEERKSPDRQWARLGFFGAFTVWSFYSATSAALRGA